MYENQTEKRTRKHCLKVYLDDDEKAILESKFRGSGLQSISQFLRYMIVYGNVYITDYRELQDTKTAINRIGNNINQIAKKMNETGTAYIQDVKEIKSLLKKIQKILEDALDQTSK